MPLSYHPIMKIVYMTQTSQLHHLILSKERRSTKSKRFYITMVLYQPTCFWSDEKGILPKKTLGYLSRTWNMQNPPSMTIKSSTLQPSLQHSSFTKTLTIITMAIKFNHSTSSSPAPIPIPAPIPTSTTIAVPSLHSCIPLANRISSSPLVFPGLATTSSIMSVILKCKDPNSAGARGRIRVWWETHQTIEWWLIE